MSDPEAVDLAFSLAGGDLPEDYADALWLALQAALPWLADDAGLGVHPLARVSLANGRCYLSKHTRLTLRLGADQAERARELSGARIEIDGTSVEVGEARIRPLATAKVMYSPFVAVGLEDEQAFLAECRRQLAELGIEAQPVVGKALAMKAEGALVHGFSLMLHGLRNEHALALQRAGVGMHRKRGCGIFVQHKSVAPLSGD